MKDGLDPKRTKSSPSRAYEITAVSLSSQVANLKNAGAEVVTTVATPGFTAQAIKEADRLGWHPQWLLSYVNSDDMLFQFVCRPSSWTGPLASRPSSWRPGQTSRP